MQLQRENARRDTTLDTRDNACKLRIGERLLMISSKTVGANSRAIWSAQHNTEGHDRLLAQAIGMGSKQRSNPLEQRRLSKRTRSPIVAFNDQHRITEYRLSPKRPDDFSTNEESGKPS